VSTLVADSLALARAMRADRQWRARAARLYWVGCLRLTGIVERWLDPGRMKPHTVLNFGCGNHFLDHAVNADIFAPHRFVLRKRRPELFWQGTSLLPGLAGRFRAVICEHVIEHLLPDDAMMLLRGLRHALVADGAVVISFPDLGTILSQSGPAGRSSSAIEVNSTTYGYGHRFMYDRQLVLEMLEATGFTDVSAGPRLAMPHAPMLLETREPESAYVTGRNCQQSLQAASFSDRVR
jgi:hypothetical protein